MQKIVPLNEQVKVFIRLCPNPKVIISGIEDFQIVNSTTLKTITKTKEKLCVFNKIFPEPTTQEEIYGSVSPLVLDSVNGYHTCVFAHGAVLSGKSHTIIGDIDDIGIRPRAIHELFQRVELIQKQDPLIFYHIELSFVEVYNNKVRNLLKNTAAEEKVNVHESQNLGVFLTGSNVRQTVKTEEAVVQLIDQGTKNRAVRVHNNHNSSRSHAILTFHIERRQVNPDAPMSLALGTLTIVDLAGIEKLTSESEAKIEYLEENKFINSSLNSLGDVLCALAEESTAQERQARRIAKHGSGTPRAPLWEGEGTVSKFPSTPERKGHVSQGSGAPSSPSSIVRQECGTPAPGTPSQGRARLDSDTDSALGLSSPRTPKSFHIPYLNSKLSHVLKESLGGNCKTIMIATIHGVNDSMTNTALVYAEWAMKIRHSVHVNDIDIKGHWLREKDPEATRLRVNLESRSTECENAFLAKKLSDNNHGSNLSPPPPLIVGDIASTARAAGTVALSPQEIELSAKLAAKDAEIQRLRLEALALDATVHSEEGIVALLRSQLELQKMQNLHWEQKSELLEQRVFAQAKTMAEWTDDSSSLSSDSKELERIAKATVFETAQVQNTELLKESLAEDESSAELRVSFAAESLSGEQRFVSQARQEQTAPAREAEQGGVGFEEEDADRSVATSSLGETSCSDISSSVEGGHVLENTVSSETQQLARQTSLVRERDERIVYLERALNACNAEIKAELAAKAKAIEDLRAQVATINRMRRESDDAATRRVVELEKKLAGEEVELAAKAKALEDMRKYIVMLTKSKDSSALQVVEMKSRRAAEVAELAEKLRIIDQLRMETERQQQASNKAAVNVAVQYAELNEFSSSDDEKKGREVVEVERTVVETEELIIDGQSSETNRNETFECEKEKEKEGNETDSQKGQQVGEMRNMTQSGPEIEESAVNSE